MISLLLRLNSEDFRDLESKEITCLELDRVIELVKPNVSLNSASLTESETKF